VKSSPATSEGGLPAKAVETTGDRENLKLLASREVDLALVSGAALTEYLGAHPDAPFVTVCAVWPSGIHFLLRDRFIKTDTVGDLTKRKLYLGPAGSPERDTVDRIMDALGVVPNRYAPEVSPASLLSVMTDFKNQALDGAVLIGPVPDPMARDIIDNTGRIIRLIGGTTDEARALDAAGLPAFVMIVPGDTYPFQADELSILAVGNYLIARKDLPDETASFIVRSTFENAAAIARHFPQGGILSREQADKHLVLGLHPGAKRYLDETQGLKR
jgi:TRAP transporter TAXI family solute receptor